MTLRVRTADLAPYLNAWIDRFRADHPQPPQSSGPSSWPIVRESSNAPLTAIRALEWHTAEAGHRVNPDSIERIRRQAVEWVDFWKTADPLLCAIGGSDLRASGAVPVYRYMRGEDRYVLEDEDELLEAA